MIKKRTFVHLRVINRERENKQRRNHRRSKELFVCRKRIDSQMEIILRANGRTQVYDGKYQTKQKNPKKLVEKVRQKESEL
jgi:hypothetical protein